MKKPVFLLLLFLAIPFTSATYISGEIILKENGDAIFNVETDVPLDIEGLFYQNERLIGTTELLTKKEKGVWTFTLDEREYDNIFIDIKLPRNLNSITSIEGLNNLIDIRTRTITVLGAGKLDFKVSYQLEETADYSFIFWILLIILIVAAIIIYNKRRKKKERFDSIKSLVSESEEKIIDSLMKEPKRQKELRKILNIPKASFSRYLSNLEKKKLLIREGEGKNKVLRLK